MKNELRVIEELRKVSLEQQEAVAAVESMHG